MPLNQTFELPAGCSDPGHIIIALNSDVPVPFPSEEGFNQACADVFQLWNAMQDRLPGSHFIALAAMFSEYMRVVESALEEGCEELSEEHNRALRTVSRNIVGGMREAAADRLFRDDAEGSPTRRRGVVRSVGQAVALRDLESISSEVQAGS